MIILFFFLELLILTNSFLRDLYCFVTKMFKQGFIIYTIRSNLEGLCLIYRNCKTSSFYDRNIYNLNSFQQLLLQLDLCAHEERTHLSTQHLVSQDTQQCRFLFFTTWLSPTLVHGFHENFFFKFFWTLY